MNFHKHDIRPHDIKALEDLSVEASAYVRAVVLSVFNGIAQNIGIANPDKLSKAVLQKGFTSGGLTASVQKLRRLLGRRIVAPTAPFKVRGRTIYKKDGKPYTQAEWRALEDQIINHMRPFLDTVHEEMVVKAVLLAMASASQESRSRNRVAADKQSYSQIEHDAFGGFIPDSMRSAKERYRISRDQQRVINQGLTRTAAYVQQIQDDVRESVRRQVNHAQQYKLSAAELASNLYWMADTDPELKGHTVQSIWRDWDRVARTELAMIHEDGRQAVYEHQARESLADTEKAVYFVLHGLGRCKWCSAHLGVVVRQVPSELVQGGSSDDRLETYGIKDPHTSIAVWPGKSNYGYPQGQWRICAPVHPWCSCSLLRVYPEFQVYDTEKRRLVTRVDHDDFMQETPIAKEQERVDAELIRRREQAQADRMREVHRKEADYGKSGTLFGFDDQGGRIVVNNGTRYVEVRPDEANARLNQWRLDKTLPVPVSIGTKDHSRIFG